MNNATDMQLWRLVITAAEEKARQFLDIAAREPYLNHQPLLNLHRQMATLADVVRETLPATASRELQELDERTRSLLVAVARDRCCASGREQGGIH